LGTGGLASSPGSYRTIAGQNARNCGTGAVVIAQYISGLEQGRRNPTIVSIYELATALGVGHMELVRSVAEE
jgi:transcriptional regulator with XRE-family HTH domain